MQEEASGYDATTHQLVGAQESTDISIFCGHSFTRKAGRVSATCGENAPDVTRLCGAGAS